MKSILTLVFLVAVSPVLCADPIDGAPIKTRKVAPAQGQQTVVAPKIRTGVNARFHPNGVPVTTGAQTSVNPNLRLRAQGQGFGQHHNRFNLSNTPNPQIASARFNANSRIVGSERWQGQHYAAFRSYHSQWHDRDWWRHHHNRIVLIGGGWYYWDAGFWYPAWGYDQSYSYYPYDGPIYAYNGLPPDQVIANVQSSLQAQGYYGGEIDGLLGPLTRAALADYQRDHGLYMTAAIDQPTLASLGMG